MSWGKWMTATNSFNAATSHSTRCGLELLEEAGKEQPDLQKMQELIDINANIEIRNENDYTPLLVAVTKGNVAAAQLLIDNGADKYAKVKEAAPLFYAIAYDNLPMTKMLLDHGVDPEKDTYKGGLTAVMWAANLNKRDLVDEIVRHGGDLSRRNPRDNRKAADYATNNNKIGLANDLERLEQRQIEAKARKKIEDEKRAAEEKRQREQAALDMICNAGIPVIRDVPIRKPLKYKKAAPA